MNKYIAYCGLDCEKCEARLATIINDDNLREKVAKEWSELNNVSITKEMINCTGCRIEGAKTPFCDGLCEIRKCAKEKKKTSIETGIKEGHSELKFMKEIEKVMSFSEMRCSF